jgi:hypothetical protein
VYVHVFCMDAAAMSLLLGMQILLLLLLPAPITGRSHACLYY